MSEQITRHLDLPLQVCLHFRWQCCRFGGPLSLMAAMLTFGAGTGGRSSGGKEGYQDQHNQAAIQGACRARPRPPRIRREAETLDDEGISRRCCKGRGDDH
eukprot:3154639-Rhodomonas_salina.2